MRSCFYIFAIGVLSAYPTRHNSEEESAFAIMACAPHTLTRATRILYHTSLSTVDQYIVTENYFIPTIYNTEKIIFKLNINIFAIPFLDPSFKLLNVSAFLNPSCRALHRRLPPNEREFSPCRYDCADGSLHSSLVWRL